MARALGEPVEMPRALYNFFRSRLVIRLEMAQDPRKKAAGLPRNPDLPTEPEAERIDWFHFADRDVCMIHVALWQPEIAPNTGNIARLCAATASKLHLIGRLGFRLDDRHLRRAGLDYWNAVDLEQHATFADFID